MSIDLKYGRYCDECGKTILKAHRIHQSKDYCSSCYPRVFVKSTCSQCGKTTRVHRLSENAVICKACENIGRVCVRCEKPIVKAGLISGGKPVCPACVPYFRERKSCASCGRMTARLSAMPSQGITDKICDSCRNKVTHRTCSVCRKYRKVAGEFEGKPYCASCSPDKAETHFCPDCHVEQPGTGNALCRSCLNRRRLDQESDLLAAAMTHDWMRQHCREFGRWLWHRQSGSPKLSTIYRSHQQMLERIDVSFATETDISASALLATFSVSMLRKHLLVIQYFQNVLNFHISALEKSEAADIERINSKLLQSKGESWHRVLHEYAAWLDQTKVAIQTKRLYMATAEAFCRAVKLSDTPWVAEHAELFLKRHPGRRTNLSRFVQYCNRMRGWDVVMPKIKPRRAISTSVPNTVPQLKKLLRRVDEAGIRAVDRATLCRILAKVLGFKIAVIDALSASQFAKVNGNLILTFGSESIVIPPELNVIAREYQSRLA